MWSRLLVFDAEHILSLSPPCGEVRRGRRSCPSPPCGEVRWGRRSCPSPPCGEVRWGRLLPLERRFALLREGLDPLVRVIADENATDRLTLESQPQVDRAAVAERCC